MQKLGFFKMLLKIFKVKFFCDSKVSYRIGIITVQYATSWDKACMALFSGRKYFSNVFVVVDLIVQFWQIMGCL